MVLHRARINLSGLVTNRVSVSQTDGGHGPPTVLARTRKNLWRLDSTLRASILNREFE